MRFLLARLNALVGPRPTMLLFLGSISYTGGQALTLALVGNALGLTAAGEYGLALGIVTPIMAFFGFGMRQLLQSHAVSTTARTYASMRLWLGILGFLAVGGAAIATIPSRTLAVTTMILAAARAADLFGDLFTGFQLNSASRRWSGISPLVNGALTPVLAFVGVYIFDNLESVAVGSLAASMLAGLALPAVWGANRLRSLLPLQAPWDRAARALLVGGLSLGAATGASALAANMPRYFLAASVGIDAVGQLAIITAILGLSVLPVQVLSTERLSLLGKAWAEGNTARFKHILRSSLAISLLFWLGVVVVTAIIPTVLLRVFVPQPTESMTTALTIFAVAYLPYFIAWPFSSALTATGQFSHQLLSVIVFALVLAGMLLLLIPQFGLLGSAYAFGVAQSIRVLTLLLPLRKAFRSRV